ncbi:MAG TPA: hypothetical protein VMH92_03975 [Acidocella sp.]|nr:hypothetical protein [Acidocella sp.]
MKWLDFIRTPDGRADEMAACCILGVLGFIGLAVFSVVANHQPFSPLDYGAGLGSAIGGAAAGMGLKSKLGG